MAICACGMEFNPQARRGRPRVRCEVCSPPRLGQTHYYRRTRTIRTARDVIARIDELEQRLAEDERRYGQRSIRRHGRDVVRRISWLEEKVARQERGAARRAEAERRRELERRQRWASAGVCGCGRDYLTVPLEHAHICPNPLPPPRLREIVPGVYAG